MQSVKTEQPASVLQEDRRRTVQRLAQVFIRRLTLLMIAVVSNLRFRSSLEKTWACRYARLRADAATHAVSAPSRMWQAITLVYRLLLRGRGFHRFKSTMGRFFAAWEPTHPRMTEALYHLYWSSLKERDVWGLLDCMEEPELGGGDFLMYRGRRVSIDLLQSIDEFYSLREAFGFDREDPIVFCELGAGYGRLAHVVLTAMPNAQYLLFDLPESLIVAEYYLATLHPAARAAFYPESDRVLRNREAFRQHRLLFGLPHLLCEVPRGTIDIFLNIYSFMEMNPHQVETYFRIIEELRVGAVYLKQNKREVNPFEQTFFTEHTYPIRPSWTRVYQRTSALYDHVFESAYWVQGQPVVTAASPLATNGGDVTPR